MGDNGFAEMARQAEGRRVSQEWVERALAAEARLAEADEKLRRIRRMSEVTAALMRDPERTGGWSGSERVARQFDRLAALAATTDSASVCAACDGKGYVPRNNPLHPFADKRCPDCGGDKQTPL